MTRQKKHRGGLAPNKYLSDLEYDKLIAYVRQQGDIARQRGSRRAVINELLVETLLFTGMRAEEICSLQVRDLPLSHGKDVVYVRSGKGNVSRTIEISSRFAEQLTSFVKGFRKNAKPGSAVFVNERGYRWLRRKTQRAAKSDGHVIEEKRSEHSSRLTYDSLYSRVRIIGHRAGVSRLTPHMLRHTYCTRLYNVTKDLLFVKDQAGHSNLATTAIYAVTSSTERRRQVEALYY